MIASQVVFAYRKEFLFGFVEQVKNVGRILEGFGGDLG